MNFSFNRIVAAIDVGHGHTKWGIALPGGVRRYGIYPSLTPQTSDAEGYDVTATTVNGKIFQIGPEAHLCVRGSREPRQHDDDFSLSDGYYALHIPALADMQMHRIDRFVAGLPLSTIASHKAALAKRLSGDHQVPNRHDPRGGSFNVHIAQVDVVSQPAGALIAIVTEKPGLARSNKLVVDLGFRTLDALTTVGMRPQRQTSCVIRGGQLGALQELNRVIAAQYRQDHPQILRTLDIPPHVYERLLREENPVLRPGIGEYPLKAYWRIARERVFSEYLSQVASSLEGAVIDTVILAGGGAADLEPQFKQHFPHLSSIIKPERPQFAIVEGFLQYGLQKEAGLS